MINRIAKKNALWLSALGLAAFVGLVSSCQKDVLEGQPEWLGNSIYERLEEGIEVNGEMQTFSVMLRLIDDLDQKQVLAQTGSKTLFVASDKAFNEWFKSNDWGVSSYDQLSLTQKKMLMNNAMINNAYLVDLMSNVPGNPPQMGLCMRRPTAASIFDTVYTMSPDQMPNNPMIDEELDAWKRFRENGKSIKIFKDNTSAPMIHFLPKFMVKNKITDDDLNTLTNGQSTSNNDSWINGHKVISTEQTCKNGYVYVVDGVIEPSRNMAEIISENPQTTLWAKMMNRFAIPVYDRANSREYNRLNGTNDSVYTLRYYSDYAPLLSGGNGILMHVPDAEGGDLDLVVGGRLSFDPGWNQYMFRNPMGYDLHYDAGAMIVPTDDAVREWWNGAGSGLRQEYGELDSLPISTLAVLMRVHMLPSFIESVPSKFRSIVDDAKVELGITRSDVVGSLMGCNGVVYLTNKVFPPSEFRSVVYPALASQSLMGVIYQAVKNYDYGPFLNSMESQFSMILPNNTNPSINPDKTEAKYMQYLDPCTSGLPQQILYEFYFDQKKQQLTADRYIVSFDMDGNMIPESQLTAINCPQSHFDGSGIHTASGCQVQNRLADMVNNLIIIGRLNPEQKFYKTKAGSTIVVDYKGENDVTFAGGLQFQNGQTIAPIKYYDMTKGSNGNGVAYATTEVPMTSSQSLFEVLKAHAKEDALCNCEADSAYRMFYTLLQQDTTATALLSTSNGDNLVCANNENDANMNCRLFDNYNYTVYVPTNQAIRELIGKGYLPTWEDWEAYKSNVDAGNFIANRIQSFLRYHIQDNSIFVGGAPVAGVQYETSKLNEKNRRFYSVTVSADANGLQVTDQLNTVARVVKTEGLYNNICRELWMTVSGKGVRATRSLVSSSNAVVHQIDKALIYNTEFQTDWYSEMRKQ